MTDRRYFVVSPCRNEAAYMRATLDSMVAQSQLPALWVIVDDGSIDETPAILAEYAARYDWVTVVTKPDRGHRAVGPGVVEAFYHGFDQVDAVFPYIVKLDLDLDLPPRYFETLIDRMEADPRIGTCSGKPYVRRGGALVSERRGDEMSVGMTKLWRRTCFDEIGGIVPEVMWDAIDCHMARMKGWRAISWDHPDLNFEHLRPMGSSEVSIWEGRKRHGRGQYFMGSDPLYFTATAVFRALDPPYVLGGIAMLHGFFGALFTGQRQFDYPGFRPFLRRYQRRALIKGRRVAIAEIAARQDAARDP